MYPLLSFRSLSSHVKHAILQGAEIEMCFGDTSGTKSCAQDVLIGGDELFAEESIEVVEEAVAVC